MPFKSEAQRRFFYAKASEPGEEGKKWKKYLRKYKKETPKGAKLPEKVKTAVQLAFEEQFFSELSKIAEEMSTADRALLAAPGIGALLGGYMGASRPEAFSPEAMFPEYVNKVGLKSKRGRAMSAALGAGTMATLGWLPAAMRDTGRAIGGE